MTLILIIFCIWGASALARATKEAARQKEIDRQRREQAARSAELARMTAEWKQRQAEAKIETARLIALEREAMRQREVERKQAEWNARQEEINRKHDEQIAKLNNKLSLVEREIDHYRPMLEALEEEIEALDNKVWYFESKGLPCSGYKKQLAQKKEQAYRMETKVIKAEFERDEIMDKLAS